MRILYLHGLQGSLNEEKRAVLAPYGEVFAPSLDYYCDNQTISNLYNQYCQEKIDVVIGSSMGGFAAYYLSLLLSTPCLAFNPALPKRSVEQLVPEQLPNRGHYLQVILGSQDDTVDPKQNMKFLEENLTPEINSRIHVLNRLEHRIPLEVFQQEVTFFFSQLK